MHHPPKKYVRNIRNQVTSGTFLLVGRELPEIYRVRESKPKDNKHSRSLVCKDRFFRIQDFQFELNGLKVDGKEVGSSLDLETLKAKCKQKSMVSEKMVGQLAVGQEPKLQAGHQSFKESHLITKKEQRSRPESGHKLSQLINGRAKDKQNSQIDNNGLPEISPKDIEFRSEPINERKMEATRKCPQKPDRESSKVGQMLMKRRETVGETNPKAVHNDDSIKGKQDFKKQLLLMQFREFILTVGLTNRLIVLPEEEVQYKAYICKGNNGLLVKSILKTRPWWSFRTPSQIDNCHLVWTEWKRNKSINQLPSSSTQARTTLQVSPFSLEIKTSNKQVRQKTDKKFGCFAKLVGQDPTLCEKFEPNILAQNFLCFSAKINKKCFQASVEKALRGDKFMVLPPERERKMTNHIPGCLYLHSKKLLFQSMRRLYEKIEKNLFDVIPVTFLVTKGLSDPQFERFTKYYEEIAARVKGDRKASNIWICKPGENSNRGNGIQVMSSLREIRSLVGQKCGSGHTLIIQKYMETPFLYNKRKFDLRCYVLVTCVNGCMKGYWYEEGYVRTASKEYTVKNLENKLIHLTNDAIQKKGEQYGRFQNCNKVSLAQLERYIDSNSQVNFKTVYEQIKVIATHLIQSVSNKINPKHREFTFELFGLDFMLDDKLKPFLIEANSNPCLEVDGNVLGKVIPRLIENVVRVAIDPLFPPPYSESLRNRYCPGSTFETNQFVLVYDSLYDGQIEVKEQSQEILAQEKECQIFEGEDQD